MSISSGKLYLILFYFARVVVTTLFIRDHSHLDLLQGLGGELSAEVSPHPVTVATWPVYRDWVEAGRQTAAMVEEKVRGKLRNKMAKS